MKAILLHEHGGADKLVYGEIETPPDTLASKSPILISSVAMAQAS
jgi:hypothetical protein